MPDRTAVKIPVLRCAACGALDPGPRLLCPTCHSRDVRPFDVPGEGALVSWTVVRRPPLSYPEEGPYAVAIVDLDSGVRVTGRLRDVTVAPTLADRLVCRERRGDLAVFERAGS